MGKKVTFSLDSRSDRRGEHPIRLYVRSCDGYRFQSTVGYSIVSELWDSDRQRAIEESNDATNAKGITLSDINKRIDAISQAFNDLTSKPGAATKSALASVLDQITTRTIDRATIELNAEFADVSNDDSETEMNQNLAIIREFLRDYHDFSSKDRRRGFVNIYRPEWHKNPVQFWFNPPFGRKKESNPVISRAVMMKSDGTILVQGLRPDLRSMLRGDNAKPGKTYELDSCLGDSLSNFVSAIEYYRREEKSFLPVSLSRDTIASSFVIPEGTSRIGIKAFKNCTFLRAVSIPNSVTAIGQSAFAGCIGLTEINLSGNVAIIEEYAFEGCTGLRSVYLSNVSTIEDYAFEGCSSLETIRIPDSATKIGKHAFEDCSDLKEISIPKGLAISKDYLPECVSITEREVLPLRGEQLI